MKTVEPISTSVELVTRNIEDIRLGQRVVGTNPLRQQTQAASEIDPATSRAVRLNMIQGGVTYDLAFLLNTNHRCRSGFRASTKKPGTWRSVGLMGFDSGGCKRTTFNSTTYSSSAAQSQLPRATVKLQISSALK